MVRIRIFISSTYYGLQHLRSPLENFFESVGFDAADGEIRRYHPISSLGKRVHSEYRQL